MTQGPVGDTTRDARISPPWRLYFFYIVLALVVVICPPIMASLDLSFVQLAYGPDHADFMLFGFFGSLALAAVVLIERRRRRRLVQMLPVLLFVAVCWNALTFVTEYSAPSCDFRCYIAGAERLAAGKNPYEGQGYIYPPLLAQGLGTVYQWSGAWTPQESPDSHATVLYLWQCVLFFSVICGYLLAVRAVRVLGAAGVPAMLLIAALFIVNTPIINTLRFNQANFWSMLAVLFLLAFPYQYPVVAGLVLALTTHIKLYPAALVLPLALTRQWRAIAAFAAAFAGIWLAQTDFGRNVRVWQWFLQASAHFHRGTRFGDLSVRNVFYNLARAFYSVIGKGGQGGLDGLALQIVAVLGTLATLVVIAFYVRRVLARERSFRSYTKSQTGDSDQNAARILRFTGHVADTAAFMLLVSPLVWLHHFVIAIPVALWALITQPAAKRVKIGIGTAMIFLPTFFEVYPFSLAPLVGLLIVVLCISPNIDIEQYKRSLADWNADGFGKATANIAKYAADAAEPLAAKE